MEAIARLERELGRIGLQGIVAIADYTMDARYVRLGSATQDWCCPVDDLLRVLEILADDPPAGDPILARDRKFDRFHRQVSSVPVFADTAGGDTMERPEVVWVCGGYWGEADPLLDVLSA
jgi:hypothetical protein